MSGFKVVIIDEKFKDYEEERKVLEPIDVELTMISGLNLQEIIDTCRDADGILITLAPLPAEAVVTLKKCKVISRYGVGMDTIDVDACTEKGIHVGNVPDYCAEEVSDHALALILACARKVARRDAQVRQGKFHIGQAEPIYRIAGKKFTFLGFGMIARCLYRKIVGLAFSRIMVYDPFIDAETIEAHGAEKVEWEEGISEADFISVHMPLNNETQGIIDASVFDMMKDTAILVNTSRGGLVDEEALIHALQQNRINSAGLDVYKKEPLDMNSPLMEIENCVLTDHVSYYSEESLRELQRKAAENVRDVLLGGKPRYPVNQIGTS